VRLSLLAIGRLKDGPERALCERYAGRIQDSGRSLGFTGPDIVELAESRARRPEERKIEESAALRSRIGTGLIVALDERGSTMSSADFAGRLARERDGGAGAACFVIGGADGLDPALRQQANLTLSFGALTLPHQLVRALVLEQIYRALTILGGHPYHRA
jgi:23S rRNA (pseudouridine1915-N3)-methyltransferase